VQQRIVVAIDGPSGSGKSSVARAIARIFDLEYLDTGAMYRAFAWWSLQGHTDMSTCPLEISTSPELERVLVGGEDITQTIRGAAVTAAVSHVAADPEVRRHAVRMQRQLIAAARNGIVVEGRDITTVVAPDADVRIFLTADLSVREARRAAEFADPGTAEAMRRTVAARDSIDRSRAHSPLRLAEDVVSIDATDMTLDEVIRDVRELVAQCTGGAHDN
jgi:cytidylate kinase